MQKMFSPLLVAALLAGGVTITPAQNVGGGETITPQTVPNPDDPAVRNPQSPTSSNRGDPGSEPLDPRTGGPAIGQGQPSGAVGQAPGEQPGAAKPVAPKAVE